MRLIGAFFLLFLAIYSSNAQKKCIFNGIQGECVSFQNCAYTKDKVGLWNSDEIKELKNRSTACGERNGLCCEKIAPPIISVEAPTTVATQTTYSLNESQKTSTVTPVDLQSHPTFNMFKEMKCGISTNNNRIAHGNDSNLFEFPWAAQLGYDSLGDVSYDCAGTIISEFYVLTAAHCLKFLPGHKQLKNVRLGEYDTSKSEDCDNEDPEDPICAPPVQDVGVKSFLAHPDYSRFTFHNDIGLVQLKTAALFKQKNIRPICMPFKEEFQTLPTSYIVIGWGRTENSLGSAILQKAALPSYDQRQCEQKFAKNKVTLIEGQLCAGGQDKTDSCKGDSGSSLQFYANDNGKTRMVQYGIVSYGVVSCGVAEGTPGVYTKVAYYSNWILDNVQMGP